MQSKTSFSKYFNATLFRRNLTRFWPAWGMASFAGSLFPLALCSCCRVLLLLDFL